MLHFYPYRVTVVHRLTPGDPATRVNYCEWIMQSVHDGTVDPSQLIMTDEAWFHLSGYVHSQNSRYWDIENPHVIHEAPLHDQKVGVWCAVTARRVIGPIFFMILSTRNVMCNTYRNRVLQC